VHDPAVGRGEGGVAVVVVGLGEEVGVAVQAAFGGGCGTGGEDYEGGGGEGDGRGRGEGMWKGKGGFRGKSGRCEGEEGGEGRVVWLEERARALNEEFDGEVGDGEGSSAGFVLDDDHGGCCCGKERLPVGGDHAWVERTQNSAESRASPGEERPFGRVPEEEGYAVAGLDAVGFQLGREGRGSGVEVTVGPADIGGGCCVVVRVGDNRGDGPSGRFGLPHGHQRFGVRGFGC